MFAVLPTVTGFSDLTSPATIQPSSVPFSCVGGTGPYTVYVDGFTNPIYPTANGETLIVSVYHPNATINPSLPSIFFGHGYTSPIGNAADYSALLTNLASWGYNVVFSPYEGGVSASIAKRNG